MAEAVLKRPGDEGQGAADAGLTRVQIRDQRPDQGHQGFCRGRRMGRRDTAPEIGDLGGEEVGGGEHATPGRVE
jgi:hypothetical protein